MSQLVTQVMLTIGWSFISVLLILGGMVQPIEHPLAVRQVQAPDAVQKLRHGPNRRLNGFTVLSLLGACHDSVTSFEAFLTREAKI